VKGIRHDPFRTDDVHGRRCFPSVAVLPASVVAKLREKQKTFRLPNPPEPD
jgi:hypothetical protein